MKKIPTFDSQTDDYDVWKKDIDIWTRLTDLDKKKQALAVHLSLNGRARQATSELEVEKLECDDGIKNLIERLDRVFLQDKNWKCFNAYLEFENLRKSDDQTVDEFLSDFDLKHYKLKECGVTLPDAVVACRLVKSCNLNEVHFQLALSTVSQMTFESMRNTLKKLFIDTKNSNKNWIAESSGDNHVIKVEQNNNSVLFTNKNLSYFEKRVNNSWNNRLNGNNYRGKSGESVRNKRSNPIRRDGKVSEF